MLHNKLTAIALGIECGISNSGIKQIMMDPLNLEAGIKTEFREEKDRKEIEKEEPCDIERTENVEQPCK